MSQSLGIFLTSFIAFLSIYSLASLAGLISEKSGIVNIALDGKMIIGALVFSSLYQSSGFIDTFGGFTPYVAIIISGMAAAIYSTIFSLAVINFMSDQIIAGTALNLIAPAISLLIMNSFFDTGTLNGISTSAGWAGPINTTAIIMLIITMFIITTAWVVINKTSLGLRLRASGENPYALETSGVSVNSTRWISLTIAGFLAGMAGAMFPIALGAGTFNGTVNGSGYIAIAILIVGQWKVLGIFFTAILFSFLSSVASVWPLINTTFPSELINIIPFIIPLVILVVLKSSSGPTAIGKQYKKDIR